MRKAKIKNVETLNCNISTKKTQGIKPGVLGTPGLRSVKTPGLAKQVFAFTLVELIVVITILAILSTISFISFQNIAGTARDSERQTNISNIQKGLETYAIKAGEYPAPENIYASGTMNGEILLNVGTFGNNLSRMINVNKEIIDPISNSNYVYGTSYDNKYYQIGTSLENIISYNLVINKTYADNLKSSYVVGNYKGLLTKGSYIYNIPSLIIANTGAVSLTGTTTYYVINKGKNLVYNEKGEIPTTNSQTRTEILQELTGTSATLTVTGITMPIDATSWNTNSGTLRETLGYPVDIIGHKIYGDKYFTSDNFVASITNDDETPEEPETPTCTSWTYSTGTCQPDNTASLTVLTSLPSGCSGGTPLIVTSCTYIPPTYAISSCPTVNTAQNGTTPTRATILANITNYIGCSVSGYTGKIAGYTYSGSKIEANKMVLLIATANEASTQWGLYGTDLATLANITAATNTTTMTDNIVSWDGLSNTNKIVTRLTATGEINKRAQLCNARGTGRYLPATEELNQLYCYSDQAATGDTYYGAGANHAGCVAKGYPTTHIGALTGFISYLYWSSTEYVDGSARRQNFTIGFRLFNTKNNAFYVRCVSRF